MRINALIVLLLFALLQPLTGLELEGIEGRGGISWTGNSDSDSAPSPIVNSIGICVPLHFTPLLSLQPSLTFSGSFYFLRDGRALPAEAEEATSSYVLAFLLDVPLMFTIPLHERLTLDAGLGPAFLFRFPVGSGTDRESIATYLFASGRFLLPSVGFTFNWRVFDNLRLRIGARALLPLYRLWDGEGAPFWDGMQIGVFIGMERLLGRDAASPATDTGVDATDTGAANSADAAAVPDAGTANDATPAPDAASAAP